MVAAFRSGINYLADPAKNYFPVWTEANGMLNMLSGVAQIGVGHAMKCSSQALYYRVQSRRHIHRGTNALKVGAYQFLPGAVTATCVAVSAYIASSYFNRK